MTYSDLRHRIGLRYGHLAAEQSQGFDNLVEVAKMIVGEQSSDSVSNQPASFEDAARQFAGLFGG